ncbi:MAG: hypothetical protein LQ349_008881, partial [Xanthoria aureola]
MATHLSWLRTCKLKQLEAIARATGLNSSGTKPILISHLQDGLSQSQSQPSLPLLHPSSKNPQQQQQRKDDYKIISIDMGIRNLAYCHLALPPSWLHPNTETPSITPTLTHWSRINVSSPLTTNQTPHPKESFTPATYAPHAHTFLTTHILPHNPTHILIERQRFRSMGGSAVQEWTLRVNMFEAMLYAVLHTWAVEGRWGGEVVPVLPSKVGRYWLLEGAGEDDGVKKAGKRGNEGAERSKARKMGIVTEMVRSGSGVVLEGQAEEMGGLVMGKAEGKKKKKADKGQGLGKFDDLAD